MHAYIHTCMHTYIHTYIHIYVHTYIHTFWWVTSHQRLFIVGLYSNVGCICRQYYTHVEDQIEDEENVFDAFHSSGHHLGLFIVGISPPDSSSRLLEIRFLATLSDSSLVVRLVGCRRSTVKSLLFTFSFLCDRLLCCDVAHASRLTSSSLRLRTTTRRQPIGLLATDK